LAGERLFHKVLPYGDLANLPRTNLSHVRRSAAIGPLRRLVCVRSAAHHACAARCRFSVAVASFAFNAPISKLHMDFSAKVAPVVAAGVLAASAMPAFAGDAGAGEQVFSGNCAACHAGGMNVIMPEKTLQV
jgi:hypothetical protein